MTTSRTKYLYNLDSYLRALRASAVHYRETGKLSNVSHPRSLPRPSGRPDVFNPAFGIIASMCASFSPRSYALSRKVWEEAVNTLVELVMQADGWAIGEAPYWSTELASDNVVYDAWADDLGAQRLELLDSVLSIVAGRIKDTERLTASAPDQRLIPKLPSLRTMSLAEVSTITLARIRAGIEAHRANPAADPELRRLVKYGSNRQRSYEFEAFHPADSLADLLLTGLRFSAQSPFVVAFFKDMLRDGTPPLAPPSPEPGAPRWLGDDGAERLAVIDWMLERAWTCIHDTTKVTEILRIEPRESLPPSLRGGIVFIDPL